MACPPHPGHHPPLQHHAGLEDGVEGEGGGAGKEAVEDASHYLGSRVLVIGTFLMILKIKKNNKKGEMLRKHDYRHS